MKVPLKRFNDLRIEDIKFDFQMHTCWTDGQNTPEEMIQQAKILGLESIAFTEHVNEKTNWYLEFFEYMDKLRKLRQNEDIRILIGIEAKPIDFEGTLSAPPCALENSEIVVGSVHRYSKGLDGLIPLEQILSLGASKAAETEFNLISGLLKNERVNIIGHPFGVYSRFFSEFPDSYLRKIMKNSLGSGIAIEINTRYRLDSQKFFRLLREINPYVSIGSDAHKKDEIARDFEIIKKEISK